MTYFESESQTDDEYDRNEAEHEGCLLRKEMERELDRYRTNKILSGKGLQDEPEWVEKFRSMLNE